VKLLHIDIDAGILGRRFVPDVAVQSDARLALDDLYEMARGNPEMLERNADKRVAWASSAGGASRRDSKSPTVGSGKNVDWSEALKDIQPALDDGATMTVDQGAFSFHGILSYLDFNRPGSLLAPAGGAMGFAFPAALGAQFALENRKVICMCGDGGFAMSLPDLETAVRYDLPVTTVVANDRAYGLIAGKQLSQYDGRLVGSHLGKCDFAAVADALGASGITVERTSQFKSALKEALDTKGPSVIDVVL
jgi:acetolactate synthase-1/2/3 large subunit